MSEIPPHPLETLKKFGIKDTRFATVAAYLCILTLAFIGVRVHFFLLRSIANDGTSFGWWAAYIFPILAVTVLVCLAAILRQRHRIIAARRIETRLENERFAGFRKLFQNLLEHSLVSAPVELRYDFTSELANARVSKRGNQFFITVTRGLWQLSLREPEIAKGILAHEISHMEMDDIRRTALLKAAAWLAFLILLGGNLIAITVYAVRHFEFYWLDEEMQFLGLITASLVPSFAMFLFYQEYLIGRELLHDLRAIQLTSDVAPLNKYFLTLAESERQLSVSRRLWRRLTYLIHLHPTPRQRLRNFPHPDLYRNQSVFYPLLAGAFLALLPIEIGWVMSDLRHYERWRFVSVWDDPITWTLTVITLFLLLRTEISRLSIDAIRRTRQIARFLSFCCLLASGAVLAIAPFLAASHFVRGRPLIPILEYAVVGGLWAIVAYLGMGICLGYLFGVSSLQRVRPWVGPILSLLIMVWSLGGIAFFHAISLSRGSPPDPLFGWLAFLFLSGGTLCVVSVLFGGCPFCLRRAWDSLLLRNKCPHCGTFRVPELRAANAARSRPRPVS